MPQIAQSWPDAEARQCTHGFFRCVTHPLVPLFVLAPARPRPDQRRVLGGHDGGPDAGAAGGRLCSAGGHAAGDGYLCLADSCTGGGVIQRIDAARRGADSAYQSADRRVTHRPGRAGQRAMGGHGSVDRFAVGPAAAGHGDGAVWLAAQSCDVPRIERVYPGSGATDFGLAAGRTHRVAVRLGCPAVNAFDRAV